MNTLRILLFFFSAIVYGQYAGWSSFYSYNQITGVVGAKDGLVYGLAENSLFSYDPAANEVVPITTVNGLLGDDVNTLSISDNYMMVGYQNGMLGVHNLKDGSVAIDNSIDRNITIPRNNKAINSFLLKDQTLYISANYGISSYDFANNLFMESYFFGVNNSQIQVNQTALVGTSLYAATEKGLYKASTDDPNLVLESAWSKIAEGQWKAIGLVNNTLLGVIQSGAVSICTALINDIAVERHRESGTLLWVDVNENALILSFSNKILSFDADQLVSTLATATGNLSGQAFSSATQLGDNIFIGTSGSGLLLHNPSETRVVSPSGPLRNDTFDLSVVAENDIWIAHGAFSQYYNPYPLNAYGISRLSEGGWQNLPYSSLSGARSIVSVVPNPNDTSQVFACAMHQGLLEINNGVVGTLWNHNNSGLESLDPFEFGENPNYRSVRIRDVAFDSKGSMWSITSYVAKGLKKRSVDGNWQSVDLLPLVSSPTRAAGYSKIEISPNDEIYFGSSSSGLIGYAEINGTPVLRSIGVAENLPAEDVRSVALDYDDNLWIGTTDGLRVLYGARRMFTQDVSASTVILEEGGNVGELLASQNIKAIEVDGNNQKWVATDGAGVFLFTEDGKKTIHHFTKENSPLPTNFIQNLAYDNQSGKIFIATSSGLVAFQGSAFAPSETLENIEVYPNPIRPRYTGPLTIRGLKADCVVKITDIAGNAVFETTSTGGSVQWDMNSFSGKRVRSGVYLIFITTKDGMDSSVEKVMIIN
ncbi:MAG: two-component regulator propeller domain-containing protein [Bacteroidota bacterium]|nr:two-component regulator propeller domain-containing protein [Bacteroidota bacterium]MEC8238611.1 two-component regulator propeller domain-containing protein [Bacteroidota bacterium]